MILIHSEEQIFLRFLLIEWFVCDSKKCMKNLICKLQKFKMIFERNSLDKEFDLFTKSNEKITVNFYQMNTIC